MRCEDDALIMSVTLAKFIARDKSNQELAVITSFLSTLATNIGSIIQNRVCFGQSIDNPCSFCTGQTAQPPPLIPPEPGDL